MLKIIKKENIIQDGVIDAQVKGKLIKFYFKCNYPNVLIQIENQDNEIIWGGFLDLPILNIYPRKIIDIVQKTKLEHFYLFPNHNDLNNIFVKITGLEEGQSIDMIKVLYEDTNIINSTQ